ncbi:hypothetical protein [Paludibacterium yongneupense]|nr:hypothetical protein [Paludibacterium yongneupense]
MYWLVKFWLYATMLAFGIALIRHARDASSDILPRTWRQIRRSGIALAAILLLWTLWRLRH